MPQPAESIPSTPAQAELALMRAMVDELKLQIARHRLAATQPSAVLLAQLARLDGMVEELEAGSSPERRAPTVAYRRRASDWAEVPPVTTAALELPGPRAEPPAPLPAPSAPRRLGEAHDAVAIDVTRLLGRLMDDRLPTGVDRVSLAYLQHYGGRARALVRHGNRSGLFSEAASARVFDLLLRWQPSQRVRTRLLAWQGVASCIGRGDGGRRFMFNTGHSGLESSQAAKVVRYHNVRPVYLVHDLIPWLHPEFCRPGEAARHHVRLQNMLRLGAGLIANSQDTLRQVRDFAHTFGLPMPPAIAAPLAPATPLPCAAATDATLPTPAAPYFVAVGTIEPRKNHLVLLQAWQRLAIELGAATPHLVLIGQLGWECENVEDLLQRNRVLRGHVTHLRACSDAHMAALLRDARALLFPSFAEGYGMPVIEALQAGVPVIASRLPVLREIAREVPDYLDPLDTLDWIARIKDYAKPDSAQRGAQLHRLRGFAAPQWRTHFEAVDDFLRDLDARR